MSGAPSQANAGAEAAAATLRLPGLVLLTLATGIVFAIDWHSPVRVGLVVAFLVFVPGLALAEVLEIREPVLQLAIAPAASLAVETLVVLALLYAGLFSSGLAFAIVAGLTVAALAAARLRAGRSVLDSEASRASA